MVEWTIYVCVNGPEYYQRYHPYLNLNQYHSASFTSGWRINKHYDRLMSNFIPIRCCSSCFNRKEYPSKGFIWNAKHWRYEEEHRKKNLYVESLWFLITFKFDHRFSFMKALPKHLILGLTCTEKTIKFIL